VTGSATLPSAAALVPVLLPSSSVYAQERHAEELATLVRRHGSLYEWAASQPQPRALRGRAPVYVATLPQSGVSVVVRHAWHGGLLAPFTRDLFRRPTRAPLEYGCSRELQERGIPTTDVLGYVLYNAPLGLAQVDVVTRYVDDTVDLGMVLAGLAPNIECEAALEATLQLLESLASHGVLHPDLNVKNILLHTPQGAAARAMVIDVDVVQIGATSPQRTMERNVARLVRSLHKWNRQFGCDMAEARITAFAATALARTPHTGDQSVTGTRA
jgi:hypothetical protein